jgi:hypothetical protein
MPERDDVSRWQEQVARLEPPSRRACIHPAPMASPSFLGQHLLDVRDQAAVFEDREDLGRRCARAVSRARNDGGFAR